MKIKWQKSWRDDMGQIPEIETEDTPSETAQEEWLWHTNSMRRHDGLRELELDDFIFNRRKKTVESR